MRILCAMMLAFVSTASVAGEGHTWFGFEGEAKELAILGFDSGKYDGCLLGVRVAAEELFAEAETQTLQYLKLAQACSRVIVDREMLLAAVKMIDNGYLPAGASEIPMMIMVQLALEQVSAGGNEIPLELIESWAKSAIRPL